MPEDFNLQLQKGLISSWLHWSLTSLSYYYIQL